ncbi:MAG: hypothetical protein LBJ25_02275 [Candidatus Margulisbacteria bacterium]|jgi:hypothetical protein|nr:hypothetical protein [Candidatus Margulisiibacteriota bacterium]
MKIYSVFVLPEFINSLETVFNWIAQTSPQNAAVVAEEAQKIIGRQNH